MGSAHDNFVFNTFIGTDFKGLGSLPNKLDGIYLGPGTSSTTIGGSSPNLQTKIFNSGGNGVVIQSSRRNQVLGDEIAFNLGYGVTMPLALCSGSVVQANAIHANAKRGERQPDQLSRRRAYTPGA